MLITLLRLFLIHYRLLQHRINKLSILVADIIAEISSRLLRCTMSISEIGRTIFSRIIFESLIFVLRSFDFFQVVKSTSSLEAQRARILPCADPALYNGLYSSNQAARY